MSEYIVRITDDMPYEIKAELNAWYIESEPIVRCRDCKHYELHPGGIDACNREHEESDWYMIVEPEGFCSWGERK